MHEDGAGIDAPVCMEVGCPRFHNHFWAVPTASAAMQRNGTIRREAGTAPSHARRLKPNQSEINELLYGGKTRGKTDESVLDRLVAGRAPPRNTNNLSSYFRDSTSSLNGPRNSSRSRSSANQFPDYRRKKTTARESVFERLSSGKQSSRWNHSNYNDRNTPFDQSRRRETTPEQPIPIKKNSRYLAKKSLKSSEISNEMEPTAHEDKSSPEMESNIRKSKSRLKRNISIDVGKLNGTVIDLDRHPPVSEGMNTPLARPPKASPSSMTSPLGFDSSPYGTSNGRTSPYLKYTRPPSRRRSKRDEKKGALEGISSAVGSSRHDPMNAKQGWEDVGSGKEGNKSEETLEISSTVQSIDIVSRSRAGSIGKTGSRNTSQRTSPLATDMVTSGEINSSPVKVAMKGAAAIPSSSSVPLFTKTKSHRSNSMNEATKSNNNVAGIRTTVQRPQSRRSRQRPLSSGKQSYLQRSNQSTPLFNVAYDLAGADTLVGSDSLFNDAESRKKEKKKRAGTAAAKFRGNETKFVAPPTAWEWGS